MLFLETHNDALIAYVKQAPGNTMIVVVNLDPHNAQEGLVTIPAHLGLPPVFAVEDLLTGEHFDWRIGGNYVRLDPPAAQAHVLRVVAMTSARATTRATGSRPQPLWFKTRGLLRDPHARRSSTPTATARATSAG